MKFIIVYSSPFLCYLFYCVFVCVCVLCMYICKFTLVSDPPKNIWSKHCVKYSHLYKSEFLPNLQQYIFYILKNMYDSMYVTVPVIF